MKRRSKIGRACKKQSTVCNFHRTV